MIKVSAKWSTVRTYGCWIICLGLLAGCSWVPDFPLSFPGQPTAPPSATVGIPPTPVPTVTPEATATPASQILTLQVWVPEFLNPGEDSAVGGVLNDQVRNFADTSPSVDVQISVKKDTGAGGILNLITTAAEVAPSVLPDVILVNQYDLVAAADAGLLRPMDDALPSDSGYFTTALEAVTTAQGLWAFPYVGEAEQMAYSPGLSETAPVSWTAVLSGSYQLLFPAAPLDGIADDALLAMYLGSGGRAVDQGGQATLDRTTLEYVYGFFSEMRNAGTLDAETVLALQDAAACWAQFQEGTGQLTPVPVGTYWLAPVDGNAPVRPSSPTWVPTAEGAPLTILHTWGLAIVTDDPVRQEVALGLVRWLVSAQHMADLTRAAEMVPTRRQAVEAYSLSQEGTDFVNEILSNSVQVLTPGVDQTVRRALQAGLTALLLQDVASPEAAASQALTNLRR